MSVEIRPVRRAELLERRAEHQRQFGCSYDELVDRIAAGEPETSEFLEWALVEAALNLRP